MLTPKKRSSKQFGETIDQLLNFKKMLDLRRLLYIASLRFFEERGLATPLNRLLLADQ